MGQSDTVRALSRWWGLIVAIGLLAGLVVWGMSPGSSSDTDDADSYTATATLVREPGSDQSLKYAAFFATQGDVPIAAARKLDYSGDPAVLAESVRVTADDNVGTLLIQVSDPSAKRAETVANAFLGGLTRWMKQQATENSTQLKAILAGVKQAEQRLRRVQGTIDEFSPLVQQEQLEAAQTDLQRLYRRRDEARTEATIAGASLRVVQRATSTPDNATGFAPPSARWARALLAAIGGLILGAIAALVAARIDNRPRGRRGVQAAYGKPVLAEIPHVRIDRGLAHAARLAGEPVGKLATAYRRLRSALLVFTPEPMVGDSKIRVPPAMGFAGSGVVVVTSARAGEGKTTTVLHLAARFGEIGRDVMVIDADVTNPRLREYLDVPLGLGVTDLVGRRDVVPSMVSPTSLEGVRLVQAGLAEQSEDTLSMSLSQVVAEARKLADIVLIDCPAVTSGAGAMDAIAEADAVLVVCRSGRPTGEQAATVRDLLTRLRVPVFGTALVTERPGLWSRACLAATQMNGHPAPVATPTSDRVRDRQRTQPSGDTR